MRGTKGLRWCRILGTFDPTVGASPLLAYVVALGHEHCLSTMLRIFVILCLYTHFGQKISIKIPKNPCLMLYTTFVGGAERSPEGIGTADVKTREPVPPTRWQKLTKALSAQDK